MALFTMVLEFRGGTYIRQVTSTSPAAALAKYAAQLGGKSSTRKIPQATTIAKAMLRDEPIAIHGLRNTWCCSVSVREELALLNIIQTAAD